MLKVNFHSFGLAFLFTFFTSLAAFGQTVQINPNAPIGPTILRAGWDIKGFPGRIDTLAEARGHYLNVDANLIRVPFSPRAHNEDGSVDVAEYVTELNAIRSVMAVRPDVQIYASVRLGGANTFPDWVSQPTAAWPTEMGTIFGNQAERPNPEHYSTMIRDYLSYMRDEGISVDFLGLNNETEALVPVDRYIATHDLLEAKLDAAGFADEFRNFQYVGSDSFGLPTTVRFVQGLADAGRLDAIDIIASHYYPQFISGDESDWQDLSTISGGKPLWHSELHMPSTEEAIGEMSQNVRDSLSVQFASFRNGVESYIWWDSGNNTDEVRDAVKREVMTTTLGAAPVFTTPTYQGKGDPDGLPLFQAFVEGSQVTLWIVNPGSDINNLSINMLSQQVGSCLDGRQYLAPDGDANLFRADISPLSFDVNANGQSLTIEQIASQSIAVLTFDMNEQAIANTNPDVVFSNDFEDGNVAAEIGSMTLVADSSIPSIVPVTGGADATLGSNVLLLDRTLDVLESDALPLDLTLNLTDTLSLEDDNAVTVDFDVASRRTNGTARTIYVDALDSNGKTVARLVLGDSNIFGTAGSDRQRPGYASGAVGNLPLGDPGRFWWGSDVTPVAFAASTDAHMSLTIRQSCFDVSTTGQNGTTFSLAGLTNFAGASADVAEIKITSLGENYGVYFDNLRVAGVVAGDTSVLLGDINCDGVVNFLDIVPFIAVLSSGDFLDKADIDGNGSVNFLDIVPFIALLSAP